MVLESTFICVDNSEFTRNGDFLPTRLQAQQEAVGVIAQSKLRSNPESNVGLLTLSCLDVLVTLTTDSGKILAKLHAVQPKGQLKLLSGIRIAHLALKHRLGKKHKTRIIAFIGSPISGDEKDLVKLAKKLKKEKVSVDIVNFGEVEANESLLKKFIETVNGKDGSGSHLVSIPLGPHLSDALLSSPIVQGEDGSGVVAGPGGFEFGVDPNEDPELALALRVSMEEQRARQEQQAPSNSSGQAGEDSMQEDASTKGPAPAQDDEVLLEKALQMSMDTDEPNLSAMTEDEQIAYAMKMSMQGGEEDSGTTKEEKIDVDEQAACSKKTQEGDEDYSEAMNDPAFLQNVLENLPGVDPQSDAIKQAMGAMTGTKKKSDDKSDKETKDGKK